VQGRELNLGAREGDRRRDEGQPLDLGRDREVREGHLVDHGVVDRSVGRVPVPMPKPLVALPCGSRSRTRTSFTRESQVRGGFTTVVVLPTPPF